MPQIERDFEFVSLRHPDEYPFNEGRIVSSEGIDIDVSEYNEVFEERHVARSNALQSVVRRRGPYHVGPLARYNLNFEKLHPLARQAALEAGLGPVCRNPFQSILVRSVETVHACEEALAIIAGYERPEQSNIPFEPKAGVGHGATEAPRGLLYHRYEVDDGGLILTAQIVPPTSQNQLTIEDDVRAVLEQNLDLPDEALQWRLEQTIRNYDPCISCATHFLNLEVERVSRE
jgi:coenzyme F420-reducing hydrogenase alpha subunit